MPLINYIGNRQESLGNNVGGFVRGNAPTPAALSLDYIVVGGGTSGRGLGTGGCGGGVVSGSAVSMSFNTTIAIVVGAGGTQSGIGTETNAFSSSMSGSSFGFFGAGGATLGSSGGPQYFSEGGGAPYANGGGAGSSKNGNGAAVGQNGDGGTGSVWVNGIYYAGGGGGTGGSPNPVNPGYPGLGGGGSAQGGYTLNGVNGLGGGAAGSGTAGGSGSVIIRYATGSLRMADGGQSYESGGYWYHEFTGSGTLYYGY
jgi:hypothetical protein